MIATALRRLALDLEPAPTPANDRNVPELHRRRTIFISDVHLGTRGCKADALAAFLRSHACDTLYLVGDIIDGWRLKRSWYWRPSHDAVIREVLKKAQNGTRVVYITGNHDEALRPYAGHNLAGVELRNEAIHTTADGRSFLILHGDCFDGVVRYASFLAHLGDWAYDGALWLSERVSDVRRLLGLRHWSLATYLKRTVKNAVAFIGKFEEAVARETLARGLDGAICGHIHHAQIRRIGRVLYCNDGDWVESCTALVEGFDGAFQVVGADGEPLIEERPRLALAA
ncbi:MAG: UDP-2,3-diacylglucosamine diphosphatase [Alphaproteobacteria bacterium]|nr:UDP-2,3-diacylglucosamine diphosphatase [Alphaproteobacteria bacterium]